MNDYLPPPRIEHKKGHDICQWKSRLWLGTDTQKVNCEINIFRLKKSSLPNMYTVIKLYYEIYILTAPCKYMYKSGNSFELHTTALSVRRKSKYTDILSTYPSPVTHS